MFVYVTVFLLLWGKTRADAARTHCFEKSADVDECDNGCQLGYYGDRCTKPCPLNCAVYRGGQATCSQDSGYCLNGCKGGSYGDQCKRECPGNCEDEVCDRNTGDCTRGCKSDFYGIQCKDRCSRNCEERKCKRDGSCNCKHGFVGRTCEVECSINCFDQECHLKGTINDIRVCTKGCVPGFTGSYCQDVCPDACTHCHQNGSCGSRQFGFRQKRESRSSRCLNYNYTTNQCDCCKARWRGTNCSVMCKNCVQNFVSGFCRKMCINASYGNSCDKRCPDSCAMGICNQTTGTCHGCKRGHYGHRCEKVCERCSSGCYQETGRCISCTEGYGHYCQIKCSKGCTGGRCSAPTGNCTCKKGWTGTRCDFRISPGCQSKYVVDIKQNGDHSCIGPCKPGYAGDNCRGHCLKCLNGCHPMNGTCHLHYAQAIQDIYLLLAMITAAVWITTILLSIQIGISFKWSCRKKQKNTADINGS